MRVFGKTDVGLVRKINQDFIFYSRESVGAFPNFSLSLTVWEGIMPEILRPVMRSNVF